MNKLVIIAFASAIFAACSNNVKTEQEEEKLRDSIDNVVLDQNQRFVDSLEKAEAAKDSVKSVQEVK